jgi:hypothetical protein
LEPGEDELITSLMPDGAALLARVATGARSETEAIVLDIDDAIVAAVPPLAEVRRALGACTRANVESLLDLLADPVKPVDENVPEEALRFVATLGRRGADPQSRLLRGTGKPSCRRLKPWPGIGRHGHSRGPHRRVR